MAKSIAFAADASRLAALLLSYIPARMSPSSRLASRAPRPRSSTDLAIRGPLASCRSAVLRGVSPNGYELFAHELNVHFDRNHVTNHQPSELEL